MLQPEEPFDTKQHLLVINNILHCMKRFEVWNDALENKLTMISLMRKTFEEMWHTDEYKQEAERLTEKAYEKLEQGDLESCQQLIEKLQELYTMNKMYENLD